MPELFVGLMSGTSLDGIDAAVVDFSKGANVIGALTVQFDETLRNPLQTLIEQPQSCSLDQIGYVDAALGIAYADAVGKVLDSAGVPAIRIKAIGCHGQTIRHSPCAAIPFTWQIGDPNRIAALCGIPVVADFRRMDMARGGQAAPLVPAFHAAAFADEAEVRAVVNIGGIANITRLGATVTGYDIGPGNGLMDAWVRYRKGQSFDCNGDYAASGSVDTELLAAFFSDPFFEQAPPRSTGREHFNLEWILRHLSGRSIRDENVQATLMALTVESIAREVRRAGAERLLICGGGVHNATLLRALTTALSNLPVESTNRHGVDADFVEAAAFAWLASARLAGRPGALATVTGAGRDSILGGLYLP